MLPLLLCMNPGFGLLALFQGQTHLLNEVMEYRGWGRIYCTWLMADRAGWPYIALVCTAGMIIIAAALLAAAALFVRRSGKKTGNG